jgi:hypothetical protein
MSVRTTAPECLAVIHEEKLKVGGILLGGTFHNKLHPSVQVWSFGDYLLSKSGSKEQGFN